jgi:hypothetical protein
MASLQVGVTAAIRLPPAILDRLAYLTAVGTGYRKSPSPAPSRRPRLPVMSTLVIEHWEFTTFKRGGGRITFDAPDWFAPTGDLVRAIQNNDTGCLELVWSDGTCACFPDGSDIDIRDGLEIFWTADDLLRGAVLNAGGLHK